MTVPILGALPPEAPSFTLRVHRDPRVTTVEVIRDSDSVTVGTLPFANELWDQLFHQHPQHQPIEEDPAELDYDSPRRADGLGEYIDAVTRDPDQIRGRDDV